MSLLTTCQCQQGYLCAEGIVLLAGWWSWGARVAPVACSPCVALGLQPVLHAAFMPLKLDGPDLNEPSGNRK